MKRPPAIARALPSAAGSKGHADRNRDWAAGPTAAFIVTMLAALVLLTVLHAGLPGTTAPGPASWRATAGDFALPGSFSALPLNCLAGFGLGVASTPAVAYINGVRTGAHGQQDLVTIQFANKVPSQTSISAQIGATFTPRAGGKPVTLKGSYGAMVTMQTADGHSHYSGPSEINTGDRLVLELRKVRDDSGVVQWAIGLSEVPCFRTAYLDHPNRLVIDFVRGATTS